MEKLYRAVVSVVTMWFLFWRALMLVTQTPFNPNPI